MLATSPERAPPAMALAATAVESPPASLDHTGGGGHRAVQFLQCLIGTATVLAVAWLGWSLVRGQSGVGWTAALGLAVYPSHVSAAAYPQAALWAALVLCCLLARGRLAAVAIQPRRRPSRRMPGGRPRAAGAGAGVGGAVAAGGLLVGSGPGQRQRPDRPGGVGPADDSGRRGGGDYRLLVWRAVGSQGPATGNSPAGGGQIRPRAIARLPALGRGRPGP